MYEQPCERLKYVAKSYSSSAILKHLKGGTECACLAVFETCPWMSNMKEVRSKPRLHISVNPLLGVWPPLRDSTVADRSQKPLSMRTQFPPSSVSKWRTRNKISPRNWASHKAAHTIIQTLIIDWITPSTCQVCLGIVFSEIGGHFSPTWFPLVPTFATGGIETGLGFSCLLRRRNIC